MPGISFGGGSSTDARDIGGYPHSGQGDPSGVTANDMSTALQRQRAKTGLAAINRRRSSQVLDRYAENSMDGNQTDERGRGFGGIKNLFQ